MQACSEDEALAYLQSAFSTHFGAGVRQGISHRLDAYTTECARRIQQASSPGTEALISDQVTGLHRRYLEAVRKNTIAKKRYEAVIHSTQQRTLDNKGAASVGAARQDLSTHLSLLQQQKRYENLSVLEKYLAELNQLDDDLQIIAADRKPQEPPALVFESSSYDTAADFSHLNDLMASLEIATIRSAADAKREHAQLKAARADAEIQHNADPVREAHALMTVRDELTDWVEQNLALCAESEAVEQEADEGDEMPRIAQEDVEHKYEEYLVTRQRLLDAAARLRLPLKAVAEVVPAERGKTVASPVRPPNEVFDAEAQSYERQLNRSMKYVKRYLGEELEKEKQESLEGLLRLVDESQLLPQYPVLAKDERFRKIIGSLGGQAGLMADDKIVEQIEAWAFAADAADKTLEATLGAHMAKASRSLDEVGEMLGDMKALKEYTGG